MRHMKYNFDDERINIRALRSFEKIMGAPGVDFPKVFDEPAALEGFYRFLHNPKVYLDILEESIFADTATRIRKNARDILAIHDTTEIHPPKSQSIAAFHGYGKFFAHMTLLTDLQSPGYVYGVGDVLLWNRENGYAREVLDSNEKENEADRWWDQVVRSNARWPERKLIHVMDSEGDACKIWSRLSESGSRYVTRLRHKDRSVKDEGSEVKTYLYEELLKAPVMAHRKIFINARNRPRGLPHSKKFHPDRLAREADLEISARSLFVIKTTKTDPYTNEGVVVNLVHVLEKGDVQNPIEWILMTSEPINTESDVLRVVDIYHSRWLVEEFFKGLKTGCNIEERMFADEGAWYRLILFLLPIVTTILNLRYQLKHPKDRRHAIEITGTQWQILKTIAQKKFRKVKNLTDAYREICLLGGHIKSNGDAGWKVILRGYTTLLNLEEGWNLAMAVAFDEEEDVISP